MISVDQLNFVAVDIETSGLDPGYNHVLEIGWQGVRRGELFRDAEGLFIEDVDGERNYDDHWIIERTCERRRALRWHPLRAVLARITSLGWDVGQAVDGSRPRLAFHNAPFDLAFIGTAVGRRGGRLAGWFKEKDGPFDRHILDSQALAVWAKLAGRVESTSLEALCKAFGVVHGEHTAAGDARATAEVIIALVRSGAWGLG